MGGIISAMMAGVTTVSCLPDGLSFPQVFARAAKPERRDRKSQAAKESATALK